MRKALSSSAVLAGARYGHEAVLVQRHLYEGSDSSLRLILRFWLRLNPKLDPKVAVEQTLFKLEACSLTDYSNAFVQCAELEH